MLIDDVTITIQAGKGGDGAATFRRNEGNPRGGPDGGNGGNGGNVYVQGVNDIMALQTFRYKKDLKADDGVPGKRKNLFGRNAEDLIIPLPLGTHITVENTDEVYEIVDTSTRILLAKGGQGGRGNTEFKSATNQAPTVAEQGVPGEKKVLHLVLRLIAHVGLIGLPNAGKSSLLATLTNAHPKIGDYPFTTLEPNLGMLGNIIIADIPGLIEGASQGKGLGVKFLKHIEKTKLLVHCIDATTEDVLHAYETVRTEFMKYSTTLMEKQEIIVLTKIDLLEEAVWNKKIQILTQTKRKVYLVTVLDDKSIAQLSQVLTELYEQAR